MKYISINKLIKKFSNGGKITSSKWLDNYAEGGMLEEPLEQEGTEEQFQPPKSINQALSKIAVKSPVKTLARPAPKPKPVVTKKVVPAKAQEVPLDILHRQIFKESSFDSKAQSRAGAKGIAQIKEDAFKDAVKAGIVKPTDDIFDPKVNKAIQKFYMNNLYNADFINKPNQSEKVRLAKTLVAYNYGRGNLFKHLTAQKAKGVDIYNSLDWLKGLPKESIDYQNDILNHTNSKFEEGFKKLAPKNPYKHGGLIKRANGSYSQRGLWDNIRANRGSGKEPTKEMLEQEKKIKSKMEMGGKPPNGGKKNSKVNLEHEVDNWLGNPSKRAFDEGLKFYKELYGQDSNEGGKDNFRHPMAGRFTAEAIAKKTGNIPVISKVLGFAGSNALGLAHELSSLNRGNDKHKVSWKTTIREGLEDSFNNMVGAGVGSLPISDIRKTNILKTLSGNDLLPDGYGNIREQGGDMDNDYVNPNDKNTYRKKEMGGTIKLYNKRDSVLKKFKVGGFAGAMSATQGGLQVADMLNQTLSGPGDEFGVRDDTAAVGSGALSGAAQGASMGSMFGPWGTAIGAVGGGVFGGIMAGKQNEEAKQRKEEFIKQKQANDIAIEQNKYQQLLASGFKTQGNLDSKKYAKFGGKLSLYPNGGNIDGNKEKKQYITSDPKDYFKRKQEYNDSLTLFNQSELQRKKIKNLGFENFETENINKEDLSEITKENLNSNKNIKIINLNNRITKAIANDTIVYGKEDKAKNIKDIKTIPYTDEILFHNKIKPIAFEHSTHPLKLEYIYYPLNRVETIKTEWLERNNKKVEGSTKQKVINSKEEYDFNKPNNDFLDNYSSNLIYKKPDTEIIYKPESKPLPIQKFNKTTKNIKRVNWLDGKNKIQSVFKNGGKLTEPPMLKETYSKGGVFKSKKSNWLDSL